MRTMVLVYLPTKLGEFVRVNVGKYFSTMVRIWDSQSGHIWTFNPTATPQ